ncbi:hypothetical protein HKD37_15G044045 [Glycine soja]
MSTSFCTLNSDSALGFESILLASAGISATAAMENQTKATTPQKPSTICNTKNPKADILRPETKEKHKESVRFPCSADTPERKRGKKRQNLQK